MNFLNVPTLKIYLIRELCAKYFRVSVGITVDAPVTAVSNKTNDIQCFKDI